MRSDSIILPMRSAVIAGMHAALGMPFSTIGGLLAALIAMLMLFGMLSPTLFLLPTFTTIANEIPDLLVMVVSMTFILMTGGVDLSVGSVLVLSASVLPVAMSQLGWGLLPAAFAGVVLATTVGILTGAVTVHWGILSFTVSLGVLEMARGLAYSPVDPRTVYIGSTVDWLANPIVLGIAPSFLIAIAITMAGRIVLVRTVFGCYLVAIGASEEAARLAGVNPRLYKIAMFVLMGLLSGLATLFQVSRPEAADPNAGVGVELQVIAAVVTGGTGLTGGRGLIMCALLGALIISVLESGLA